MIHTLSVWGSWDAGCRQIEIWSSLLRGRGAGVPWEGERVVIMV